MAVTVSDIIAGAMKDLGALQAGEVPRAEEASDGLSMLNALVDSISTQRLMIYTINITKFSFTPGVQSYTLGSTGTWSMARPIRIESMSVEIQTANPVLEIPIPMLRDEEWQDLTVKNLSSTYPLGVYDDGGFPNRTLSFWPIPAEADKAVIYSWAAISRFAAVTDTVSLPPGYERFLRTALAIDLAPSYGREPSPTLMSNYNEAKAVLRTLNWTPNEMVCDPALLGGAAGSIAAKSRGYVVD